MQRNFNFSTKCRFCLAVSLGSLLGAMPGIVKLILERESADAITLVFVGAGLGSILGGSFICCVEAITEQCLKICYCIRYRPKEDDALSRENKSLEESKVLIKISRQQAMASNEILSANNKKLIAMTKQAHAISENSTNALQLIVKADTILNTINDTLEDCLSNENNLSSEENRNTDSNSSRDNSLSVHSDDTDEIIKHAETNYHLTHQLAERVTNNQLNMKKEFHVFFDRKQNQQQAPNTETSLIMK